MDVTLFVASILKKKFKKRKKVLALLLKLRYTCTSVRTIYVYRIKKFSSAKELKKMFQRMIQQ